MRVALFARYSSSRQDALSLEAQVAACEAYCAREGWTIVRRFLLPEVRSADIDRSQEFVDMLQAARHREFDVLLAHKLDRFGRDRVKTAAYKQSIRNFGVQVRTVVENLGDTALDEAMEGLTEVFARLYQRNLGDETRKGQSMAVRKGLWRGGAVPWGLQATQKPGVGRGRDLEPHPVNGPIMREVFERIAQGERSGKVLDWVAERTGKRWAYPSLYERLRNPVYYGLIRYGETQMRTGESRRPAAPEDLVEGRWAGLVTEDLWRQANAQLDARGGSRGSSVDARRPVHPYILAGGLASCSRCGRPIIGSRFKGQPRYCCSGRRDKSCGSHTVRAEVLEGRFLEEVRTCLNPDAIRDMVAAYERSLAPEREAAKVREAELRRALTDVRRKKSRLLDQVESGVDDPDIIQRLKERREEESRLAEEIALCQVEADRDVRLDVSVVDAHLSSLGDLLDEATPEEMRRLLPTFARLTLDLETGEGQLHLVLAPSGETRPFTGWVKSGRSAPTGIYPNRPGVVRRFMVV